MGTCCSKEVLYGGFPEEDVNVNVNVGGEVDEESEIRDGDDGARIRLQGSSRFTSMYTQQGKKGVNQDAITVWEEFTGEEDMVFCGVFDGHGPHGHKVSGYVRDNLPSKISSALKLSQLNRSKYSDDNENSDETIDGIRIDDTPNTFFSLLETSFSESFKETDEELGLQPTIDSYCSGCTAVNVLKQGDHLIISNLGDSRAVLCTRGDNSQLRPVQLTVDMKPDIAAEAERIRKCNGRTFAMDEEPEVCRVWMPDEDCPGLAMSRAFGDFCLKDCGLIATPEVFYRKLTNNDEFVVLATDGVWDVLTNADVVKIVASAKKRSTAAKLLVNRAVRAWRYKFPTCLVDDCAAICLFLKNQPTLTKHVSKVIRADFESVKEAISVDSKKGVKRADSFKNVCRSATDFTAR